MTTFGDRERDFETRFKHDQELQFKVKARRNQLIGRWAAERMGMSGETAEAYASDVVNAEFDGGDKNVIDKLLADLTSKGESCTLAQVQFQLDHFGADAKRQIMSE
ncbi:MAG: DUF1476 domain-containing protein [Alphaproteobacteria bacterium]|nr:DUF1476 domain-containing protein [Alphaproteobacteria bacterium]